MYYYSSIGLLAAVILMIENHDILLGRSGSQNLPAIGIYRRFLFAVLIYYVTDVLWGIFDSLHLSSLLFADTIIYFAAMAYGVLCWTQYVVTYLAEGNAFSRFLFRAGRVFFLVSMTAIAFNCFMPVVFWISADGAYQAYGPRYAILIFQILLLLLTSGYAIRAMRQTSSEDRKRKRYRTIGLFGMVTALLLTIQLDYPLLPLYSVGYMLGTSLLHTFVVSDEKEDYRRELLASLRREKDQHEELKSAWQLAYRDPLTGVKSKLAYVEMENRTDDRIAARSATDFAVAVFDLNGLKDINDKRGHEVGDQFIIRAARLICLHFKHSPVFRVGGDEFAVLLEGPDFENRHDLQRRFDQLMDAPTEEDPVIVAMGLAEYRQAQDISFNQVFERADLQMYQRKRALKEREETPPETEP